MRLLVFAHRAEAQTFLKQGNYKSLESLSCPLYKNGDSYLIICSEGIYNGLEATTATLSKFPEIEIVLNFGVAGALDEKAQLDSIYEVRTSYAIQNEVLEFKSFTSNSNGLLDCITSSSRTLDHKQAQKLSCFANIVDRELWAIARAASNFQKEFKAFKLISDEPYLEKENTAICEIIKEKAEYFSDKLYREYLNITESATEERKFLIEEYREFYFTVSQYRHYTTLLSQLLTKYSSEKEVLDLIKLKDVLKIEALPKQRTSILLEKLRKLLTPFNTTLQNKLDQILAPLQEARIKTTLSKNLESDQFQISATIQNEVELRKMVKALNSLDYQAYKSLMRGNLDV